MGEAVSVWEVWGNMNEVIEFDERILKSRISGTYNRLIKRVIDLILAIPLLLILSPVFIIVSLMIFLNQALRFSIVTTEADIKTLCFAYLSFVPW